MSRFGVIAFLVVMVASLCIAFVYGDPVTVLIEETASMRVTSYGAFVLLLIIAVVAMPVTVMPLIPVAAVALGPLPTALLSIVGWTLGGTIAFLLARYIGRPVLEQCISLKGLDQLIEHIPDEARFVTIVLLRMMLPVDLVSYALGLTTKIGLAEYVLATAVGVTWFSFAFAYAGEALLHGDIILLLEITLASVGVVAVSALGLRYYKRSK